MPFSQNKHTSVHVGILKHTRYGIAEDRLTTALLHRGYTVSLINPLQPHKTFPTIVIGRCEVSSSQEKAFKSYLQYYSECEKNKIPVLNSKTFFLNSQHKYKSHQAVHSYLHSQHIHDSINPPTTYTKNKKTAWRVGVKEINSYGSVVLKHPYSGRGHGVFHIRNTKELTRALQWPLLHTEGVLLQRTIEKEKNENNGYRDVRLIVCRDAVTRVPTIINGYYRNAPKGQFLTNIHTGGYITPMKQWDEQLRSSVIHIMNATMGDLGGIDMVRDTSGHWWFEEINIAFELSAATDQLIGSSLWNHAAHLVQTMLEQSSQKT